MERLARTRRPGFSRSRRGTGCDVKVRAPCARETTFPAGVSRREFRTRALYEPFWSFQLNAASPSSCPRTVATPPFRRRVRYITTVAVPRFPFQVLSFSTHRTQTKISPQLSRFSKGSSLNFKHVSLFVNLKPRSSPEIPPSPRRNLPRSPLKNAPQNP